MIPEISEFPKGSAFCSSSQLSDSLELFSSLSSIEKNQLNYLFIKDLD